MSLPTYLTEGFFPAACAARRVCRNWNPNFGVHRRRRETVQEHRL